MKDSEEAEEDMSILEVVYETAKGLHELGLIDDDDMEEFKKVCVRDNYTFGLDKNR